MEEGKIGTEKHTKITCKLRHLFSWKYQSKKTANKKKTLLQMKQLFYTYPERYILVRRKSFKFQYLQCKTGNRKGIKLKAKEEVI